jgi:hypothetical protein
MLSRVTLRLFVVMGAAKSGIWKFASWWRTAQCYAKRQKVTKAAFETRHFSFPCNCRDSCKYQLYSGTNGIPVLRFWPEQKLVRNVAEKQWDRTAVKCIGSVVSLQSARDPLKCALDSTVRYDQLATEIINKHIALCTTVLIIFESHYFLAAVCIITRRFRVISFKTCVCVSVKIIPKEQRYKCTRFSYKRHVTVLSGGKSECWDKEKEKSKLEELMHLWS